MSDQSLRTHNNRVSAVLACGVLAAAVLWAVTAPTGTARAADDASEEVTFPDVSCGATFAPTKQIAQAATTDDVYGFDAASSLPAFLATALPQPAPGALLFVKRPSGWVGIAGEASEGVQGAYVAPGEKKAVIFTMLDIEGPGHAYTIMATKDGFDTVSCSTLEFPEEVKSPETFMRLVDFNVDETDHGSLIGTADLTSEDGNTSQTNWYRYSTTDGGKTWSAPEVLKEKPADVSGIYFALNDGGNCDLKADLVKSAK